MNLLLLQYSECSLSFLIGYSMQLNHWEKLGKTQSDKRFELSPIRLEKPNSSESIQGRPQQASPSSILINLMEARHQCIWEKLHWSKTVLWSPARLKQKFHSLTTQPSKPVLSDMGATKENTHVSQIKQNYHNFNKLRLNPKPKFVNYQEKLHWFNSVMKPG